MENQENITKKSVPNSTATLVLGIVSIPTCFCFGFVGLVSGIIALVLASKGKEEFENNPEYFTNSSLGNLKAGKICGIIGVSLSSLYVLYLTIYFLIFGTMISNLPWKEFMDANNNQIEQIDDESFEEDIELIEEESVIEEEVSFE